MQVRLAGQPGGCNDLTNYDYLSYKLDVSQFMWYVLHDTRVEVSFSELTFLMHLRMSEDAKCAW